MPLPAPEPSSRADRIAPILRSLRERLDASRITLRLDVDDMDYPVVAEDSAPGVPAIADLTEIPQRQTATVQWIGREQRLLVVSDAKNHDPAPPAAMTDSYGLTAFILVPLGLQNSRPTDQVGWVSVHVNGGTRDWTATDTEIAASHGQQVVDILGEFRPLSNQYELGRAE